MVHRCQIIAGRALAEWSQADLAAASGVSLRTVQALEAEGGRDTLFSNVVAIVDALRRHGVEFASGSERYVGGVHAVRGSQADWLIERSLRQGPLVQNPPERGQREEVASEPIGDHPVATSS